MKLNSLRFACRKATYQYLLIISTYILIYITYITTYQYIYIPINIFRTKKEGSKSSCAGRASMRGPFNEPYQ